MREIRAASTLRAFLLAGTALLSSLACQGGGPAPATEAEPGAAQSASAEVPEIVRRSVAFHGWDRLPEVEVALTVTSKSGSTDVVVRHGDLFDYTVIDEQDGKRRVHHQTNDVIEVSEDGEPLPLETEEARQRARDFVSSRVYFLFPPYRLLDPSVRFEDLGVEDWGGRPLHRVRVTFEPGTSTEADEYFVYWFDPETARLEQFGYTFGGGMRFRKLINQREVEGLLFADQENYGVDEAGAELDEVTAASAAKLPLVSTVRLDRIRVTEREDAGTS